MHQYQLRGNPPFRFRWVFDYADGKPSRRGIWDTHIKDDPAGNYILNTTANLLFAAIEAQDRDKMHIIRFAECAGSDFCQFEYIAQASMVSSVKGGEVKLNSRIVGLRLVARNGQIAVWRDGRIESGPRKHAHEMFDYGRMK